MLHNVDSIDIITVKSMYAMCNVQCRHIATHNRPCPLSHFKGDIFVSTSMFFLVKNTKFEITIQGKALYRYIINKPFHNNVSYKV